MSVDQDEAAQLDAIIDSLLRDRRPDARVSDRGLAATARQLHDALPRFHPSFGFEEHLARRLSGARKVSPAPDSPAPVSSLPTPLYPASSVPVDTATGGSSGGPSTRRRRGLVAGGAIASGVSIAIPIAGAALVMWRRSRSSGGLL